MRIDPCAAPRWTVCALACAAMLTAGATAGAAETDAPADWAPADAFFYVGVPSVPDFVEAFKQTALYKLQNDPKFEDVGGKFEEGVKEALSSMFEGMGFGSLEELEKVGLGDMKEFKMYPRGGACLFRTAQPPKEKGQPPQFNTQIVADMGDDFGKLRDTLEKLVQHRLEKGGKRERTEFGEDEIVSISGGAGAGAKDVDKGEEDQDEEEEGDEVRSKGSRGDDDEEAPPFVYAFRGRTVLFGSDVELTKQTLRRLREKQADRLGANDGYANLGRSCAPLGQVRVFFNFPRAIELVLQEGQEDDAKLIAALGVGNWKPFVGTFRLGIPKGAGLTFQFNVPMGAVDQGLAKVLAMKNAPVAPPAYVDVDTFIYLGSNANPSTLLDDIIAVVERVSPEDAREFRAGLEEAETGGESKEKINLRKDVIAHLQPPLTMSLALKKPYTTNSLRLLQAAGHRNRDAMEKMVNLGGGMFKKREMMGEQVYDIQGPMQGMAMVVTGQHIASGSELAIQTLVRSAAGSAEGLSSSPVFKRLAAWAPKEAWLVLYVDAKRLIEFFVALQKKTGDAEATEGEEGQDQFSTFVTSILPMMMGMPQMQKEDIEKLEAALKYVPAAMLTVGTRGTSLDVQGVGEVVDETAK